jgi:hypothetical protein
MSKYKNKIELGPGWQPWNPIPLSDKEAIVQMSNNTIYSNIYIIIVRLKTLFNVCYVTAWAPGAGE